MGKALNALAAGHVVVGTVQPAELNGEGNVPLLEIGNYSAVGRLVRLQDERGR